MSNRLGLAKEFAEDSYSPISNKLPRGTNTSIANANYDLGTPQSNQIGLIKNRQQVVATDGTKIPNFKKQFTAIDKSSEGSPSFRTPNASVSTPQTHKTGGVTPNTMGLRIFGRQRTKKMMKQLAHEKEMLKKQQNEEKKKKEQEEEKKKEEDEAEQEGYESDHHGRIHINYTAPPPSIFPVSKLISKLASKLTLFIS